MRQDRILGFLIVLLLGARGILIAQQINLPENTATQPAPAASMPSGLDSPQVKGTLQTTTVESVQQRFDPNIKVSGDQYFHQIGTTGSYRVNTDRAKQLQEEALQRARMQKRLKEDATTTQPIRLTYESKLFPTEPPTSPETPGSAANIPGPVGSQNSRSDSTPPDDPNAYVKMPGSGGSVIGRIKPKKDSSPNENPVPTASYEPPLAEPMPQPNPTPLPPNITASDVPEFDTSAFNLPQPKKKLFSRFRSSKASPGVAENSPVIDEPSALATPLPQIPVSTPEPPAAPARPLSVFRPSSDARRANEYSMVKGQEIFAMVDGAPLKLSDGTRVKVLRVGTERSLILLYDNRQATIANSALVPSD